MSNIIDKLRLPFRKEKELCLSLYRIMGFYPHDITLYQQALMHSSAAKRNEKGRPLNNERLEFLGDAVLDAIAGDIVFRHFEGKREGFLTTTRSKLVQRETLGRLAEEMGIKDLILSSGQVVSHNSYMGGNAFEALVGAIYLDRGYDYCMRFMKKRILAELIDIDKLAKKEVNFKSKLIEWGQRNKVKVVFRETKQERDKDGNLVFGFQVMIEGQPGEKGEGYTKKEGQQLAAKLTLKRLRREPQFIDAIFAAKSNRTKMEEEPVVAVPDAEDAKQDFVKPVEKSEKTEKKKKQRPAAPPSDSSQNVTDKSSSRAKQTDKKGRQTASADEQKPADDDFFAGKEFDLSGITANPSEKSREDIIAEAEAAAFADA